MDTHPTRRCTLKEDASCGPSDLLILEEDKKQEFRRVEMGIQESKLEQLDK